MMSGSGAYPHERVLCMHACTSPPTIIPFSHTKQPPRCFCGTDRPWHTDKRSRSLHSPPRHISSRTTHRAPSLLPLAYRIAAYLRMHMGRLTPLIAKRTKAQQVNRPCHPSNSNAFITALNTHESHPHSSQPSVHSIAASPQASPTRRMGASQDRPQQGLVQPSSPSWTTGCSGCSAVTKRL